ncbi:LysM peptidoglycan-binding domain-containing protein [Terrilactibacillus sp. S3-3]|nr:LysM peptidoglycan-binding domain-containing protein [Terrilactibacillus sp. S3-3]
MSVATLKSINGLSSDFIKAGQNLKLKGQAVKQAAPANTAAAKTSADTSTASAANNVQKQAVSSNGSYVVNAGDSLWVISKNNGITISKLKKINHLDSDIIIRDKNYL